MIKSTPADRPQEPSIINEVDMLGEQVKTLALNLAIYLAKVKSEKNSTELNRLEPDFIRLVNGTVKAVGDLALILDAARNSEKMVYEPPTAEASRDHIETRLQMILEQCTHILGTLNRTKPTYR